MGIITLLKSVLGVDDDRRRPADAGTSVDVEREPAAPGERAVKGVDPTPDSEDEDREAASDDEEATIGDEETPTADADLSAVDVDVEDEDEDDEEVEGEDEIEDVIDRERGAESSADAEPVDVIKGIGAAYADRLADAGVHTVSDLAEADVESLAAATDLGPGRVSKWIDRAKARSR